MKKFYNFAAIFIASTIFAQTTISFEESEGYQLGTINGQKGWTVTEGNNGFITKQVISNTISKTGNYSFKNAFESDLNEQWLPIMGAEKSFETSLDYKNTTISYDFYGTEQMGSDFEFAIYQTDTITEEFNTLFALGFDYMGAIYMYTKMNFDGYTKFENKWQIEKWYNIKIEITDDFFKVYLDNELLYSGANDSKLNIDGMNILHNNYGGDAYYDNIIINDKPLSVVDFKTEKTKFYPNPIKDILKVDLPKGESSNLIEVYNTVGQKITQFSNLNDMNFSKLKSGNYIVNIKTNSGKIFSSKIIKE